MSKKPSKVSKSSYALEREAILQTFEDAYLSPANASAAITRKDEEQIDWQNQNEELNLKNRIEKKEVRQRWNRVLLWLVILGFVLSYLMITLIGLGIMKFDNNAFAVPSVVAAGVIQTYGLAKLAIKYFFSEDGGEKSSPQKDKDK
jgi:hypothetical protein